MLFLGRRCNILIEKFIHSFIALTNIITEAIYTLIGVQDVRKCSTCYFILLKKLSDNSYFNDVLSCLTFQIRFESNKNNWFAKVKNEDEEWNEILFQTYQFQCFSSCYWIYIEEIWRSLKLHTELIALRITFYISVANTNK